VKRKLDIRIEKKGESGGQNKKGNKSNKNNSGTVSLVKAKKVLNIKCKRTKKLNNGKTKIRNLRLEHKANIESKFFPKIKENNNPLSIISLNARSIVNKMDELKLLVKDQEPDIICIVETWLTEDVFDSEINLENYQFVRRDRKNELKSKGGGIIVYIKDNISFVNETTETCSNIDNL